MSDRDIVQWLREIAPDARAMDPSDWTGIGWPLKNGLLEAAAEIERLREELDKWRSIANQLVNGAERQIDDLRETLGKFDNASGVTTPSNVYWVAAWRRHDEAVRGE